jgi:tRNA/rRNA methyltransferase
MLTDEQLERVCVVLVRTRNPNNIGSVARAMYDFGFHDLRLVTEYPVALEGARSAVDASAVLTGARTFAGVGEAVADCSLVIGTTAGGRRVPEHPLYMVGEGCGLARACLAGGDRVALLFGSEKTGLSREELSFCHWTMTIPMFDREGVRHPSMNLGQAAAVCLYELVRGDVTVGEVGSSRAIAGGSERVTGLLREMLEESGYLQRHPARDDAGWLRRLVLRMQANPEDNAAWMGILRQVLWKMRSRDVS